LLSPPPWYLTVRPPHIQILKIISPALTRIMQVLIWVSENSSRLAVYDPVVSSRFLRHPELFLKCWQSPEEVVNLRPQVRHLNGFSPVWILEWFSRFLMERNLLGQWLHENGISPLCFLIWTLRIIFFKEP